MSTTASGKGRQTRRSCRERNSSDSKREYEGLDAKRSHVRHDVSRSIGEIRRIRFDPLPFLSCGMRPNIDWLIAVGRDLTSIAQAVRICPDALGTVHAVPRFREQFAPDLAQTVATPHTLTKKGKKAGPD